MRCALLADIHANLEALTAVLAELDRRGCDTLLCAGDLVGYGADPNACVRLLIDRGAPAVAGNHDEMATERRSLDRCVPAGRRAIRWTRRVLAPELRLYLDGLPLVREVFPGIVLCHGSLDDADEYVGTVTAARRQLAQLPERFPTARLLVCGHTHRAALYAAGGPPAALRATGVRRLAPGSLHLVNPGAVGQSRDSRALARCAIYDSDRGEVEFLEVPYEVAASEAKIRAAGLTTALHVPRRDLALQAVRRPLRWARRAGRRLRSGAGSGG